MTECSPLIAACPINVVKHNGTIGVPVPNTDIKIIKDDGSEAQLGEAGELWVKGEQVMRGYWQRPEATAEVLKMAGWQRVTSSLWTRAIASVLLTAKKT